MRIREVSIRQVNTRIAMLPDQAGLFGLATFWSLCLLSGQKSLLCGDTLWHIKVGQVILATGEILTRDIFSHTVPGKPWTAHEWLAEVFMAACYDLAGLPGVALAFFLMAGLTITLLFKACQRLSSEWPALCAVSIAALFAQIHLLARPHIFTWLFGALFLYLLLHDDRRLWLLPVLTALWSNLHGGVLLGIVLQGAFLAGSLLDNRQGITLQMSGEQWRTFRRPLTVFLLSLLALGCNPFGYALLLFPFQVSAEIFSRNIAEWQAPDLQEMWYVRVWLIMLGILIAAHGRRIPWAWRLLLIFLVYQALGHVRHLSLAALFLAPWTAMALQDSCSGLLQRRAPKGAEVRVSAYSGPVITAASCALLFAVATANPVAWQNIAAKDFALPDRYARGAIDYLQTHGYPGDRLLNEYSWGGFLLFSLDPPPKVFIDGRADMYGEKVFADYAKLTHVHTDVDRILAEYRIDWILYPKDSDLVRYLENRAGWQKVYGDDQVVILSLVQ